MGTSYELQKLIYERLVADATVHAFVRDRIYDRIPEKGFFPYIVLGQSFVIEDDAECITGVVETATIQCWSRYQGGFKEVKQVSDAVKRSLHLYHTEPDTQALVELRFLTTNFLDDPDGISRQANMQFQAIMEEA